MLKALSARSIASRLFLSAAFWSTLILALAGLGLSALNKQWTEATFDDTLGVYWQPELGDGGAPDPRLHELGQRWIAKTSPDDESADEAWRKHRLALGVPEGRAEMVDTLWLETNAAELNGVSFSKGCYVGQENTARMNWRQKVNRRLVVVPLDRSDEARRKAAYPELGLAIDHLRITEIEADLIPAWMQVAE